MSSPGNEVDFIRTYLRLVGEEVQYRISGKPVPTKVHPTKGYVRVSFGKPRKTRGLHRVKFALHHGWLPEEVDHEDRDKENNLLSNLRPATHQQNTWNSVRPRKGDLPRGVSKKGNRFVAKAWHMGKNKNLGSFLTKEEASEAYQRFCRETRGGYHL